MSWNNIDCYMIVIKDHPVSEYYADYCKPSWEQVGLSVTHFDAVTPNTLFKHNQLTFTKYSGAVKYTSRNIQALFTDTEKSCWYSHFLLWQECCFLNKPIMILEHDCYLQHPNELQYYPNRGIVFYDKAAMGSYIIHPTIAASIVRHVIGITIDCGPYAILQHMRLQRQYMKDNIVNEAHPEYSPVSNQVMSKLHGNTIDHYCTSFPHLWDPSLVHNFIEIDTPGQLSTII